MHPGNVIECPFEGIESDLSLDSINSIIKDLAVKNKRLIPFKLYVINTKLHIIFSHTMKHKDATHPSHAFFLMNDTKLIRSSATLSGLFQLAYK